MPILNRIFVLAVSVFSASALAQDQELTTRQLIQAAFPSALMVIEIMENEAGRVFSDDELQTILHSTDFNRRLEEKVRRELPFVECRQCPLV